MEREMDQPPKYSSGLELANLVVTSDFLRRSWSEILELYKEINQTGHPSSPVSVRLRESDHSNYTIIAFVTSPICTKDLLQEQRDLISSSDLKDTFSHFEFLCNKFVPSFSLHKAAITLFHSVFAHLSHLKTKYVEKGPLIITGHSLGGSVASLFTLWLLNSIDPKKTKYPLCITFGSPLIGNSDLKATLHGTTWNSCFLHIVSKNDPIPGLFISPHNSRAAEPASQASVYMPFGTFLLCSELGCACFDDPETIFELLVAMSSEAALNQNPNQGLQILDYGETVEHLNRKKIFRDRRESCEPRTDSFRACIITQLEATGTLQTQQQHQNIYNREQALVMWKRSAFDPAKDLNEMKGYMAYLEWYKKKTKDKGLGYYDSYKNKSSKADYEVVTFKKNLTDYWERMVEEVERKRQKEGAAFRTRNLYAGLNYRRMVEPLHIAEYYKEKGLKDYRAHRISKPYNHYMQLEQWLKEEKRPAGGPNKAKKKNVAAALTEDSCFWADVEEALISCQLLRNGETSTAQAERTKLVEFEQYVMNMIKNYAVSPEIFLVGSSFMKWWKEYKEIVGTSYDSQLANLMRNGNYSQYITGSLVLR